MYLFFLLAGFVFFTLVSSVCADTLPRSKRTGLDFDSVDIRYFKLFRRVDSLQSARLVPSEYADSARVEARRFSLPDTVFNIYLSSAASISVYIDNFEAIFATSHSMEWDSISAFISPVRPFYEQHPLTVQTHGGTGYTGLPFTINDSLLLLYTGTKPYEWTSYTASFMRIIQYSDIASVNGMYLGGSREMYRSAVPDLQKSMFFWGALPPECVAFLRSYTMSNVPAEQSSLESITEERYLRRWHLTAFGGGTYMEEQTPFAASDPDSRQYSVHPFAGLDVYYSFTRRFLAGVTVSTFPSPSGTGTAFARTFNGDKEIEGWTAGVALAYNIIPLSPLLTDPFELRIGIRAEYSSVVISTMTNVPYTDPSTGATLIRRTLTASESQHIPGVALETSIQYYFSYLFSLRLSAEAVAGGDLEFPLAGTTSNSKPGKGRMSTNRLALVFGAGLHL